MRTGRDGGPGGRTEGLSASAGIDLPHSYLENIDVVWKQEFRIGAAYEIENSTLIYSGLLRFADLNIVAPNTLYPMFIVAPTDKKNRVHEQLRRPTRLLGGQSSWPKC